MEHFLINSSVCLFSLWLVYKLLLENTSWHQFKRFYFLAAIIISAIVPFVVVRTVVVPLNYGPAPDFTTVELNPDTVVDTGFTLDWSWILWGAYLMGVLIMGYRFMRNLYDLRIKTADEVTTYATYKLILRELVQVPHSFFSSIYASKKDYHAGDIPDAVLQHEKAHLDQRHSVDILFIELLIVLFWFNPLLYLVKYSMKLNHEFLADQAVLSSGVPTKAYQETLLAYSSSSQHQALANTFNFPIIKKRFTIMKTHTTTASGLLRSLALIPVLALLIISCGQEEIVTEPELIEIVEEPEVNLVDKKNKIFIIAGQESGIALIDRAKFIFKRENDRIVIYDNDGTVQNFQERGYEIVEVDEISEEIEEVEIVEVLPNITVEDITEYNRLAKKHAAMIEQKGHSIYFKDETTHMQTIWNTMNEEQRANAEPWPYLGIDGNKAGEIAPPLPPTPPAPKVLSIEKNKNQRSNSSNKEQSLSQSLSTSIYSVSNGDINTLYASNINQGQDSTFATKEMMQEYKKLMQQSYRGDSRIWKNSDLERMRNIYVKMSPKQKNTVEKLPMLPSIDLSEVQPIKPNDQQFESWKNSKNYAVWIDGKVITDLKAGKYQLSDITHYHVSKVYKNAQSQKYPQPFQVNLYTKKGFENAFRNKTEIR
ncbi:M56 family metallopeptidase [Nonlabens agnitus]|uniref:Peptidase M56 domain-containing protein n=1 Tax=Nonlabens agnitus TaxID=870484 RepID=A0A2S9WX50_9FLAO|nr:M56 family metallopeptidase [Nonlabens agnitus]PRP68048.1 hypothetical protein BST86_13580 [Nonlabens agnitus]